MDLNENPRAVSLRQTWGIPASGVLALLTVVWGPSERTGNPWSLCVGVFGSTVTNKPMLRRFINPQSFRVAFLYNQMPIRCLSVWSPSSDLRCWVEPFTWLYRGTGHFPRPGEGDQPKRSLLHVHVSCALLFGGRSLLELCSPSQVGLRHPHLGWRFLLARLESMKLSPKNLAQNSWNPKRPCTWAVSAGSGL